MDISNAQIAELESHVEDVDIKAAEAEEKRTKHDVMAHLHVFAAQCPLAGPIIHVGATSCYIGDNTVSFVSFRVYFQLHNCNSIDSSFYLQDLIVIRDGLDILLPKIAQSIQVLSRFAEEHRAFPTLGFTHLQ